MMLKLNEATWYSKLIAITFFLGILPSWAFYVGMIYQQTIDISEAGEMVSDKKFIPRTSIPVATSTPEALTTAQLRIGDSIKIKGLQIMLEDIVQDSRCPIDVQCIQAGDIVARVQFKTENNIDTVNLKSDKKYIFDTYTISIFQVKPDPISTHIPRPEDYWITINVVQ